MWQIVALIGIPLSSVIGLGLGFAAGVMAEHRWQHRSSLVVPPL